jgi:predicted aldo/keto reductase-like oxidoreductase
MRIQPDSRIFNVLFNYISVLKKPVMKRRDFVKVAGASPLLACFPPDLSGIGREFHKGKLEKRTLGRTGEKLSILGLGGVVVMDSSAGEASQRVAEAVEYGVNYFDVAPSYGNAEIMLGPALKPYRKNVFLACKTQGRTKDAAMKELDESLEHLQTDHFDLYQHHAVTKPEDVDIIFGPNGAMEAFIEARKSGKIRFIGFSAHSVEAAMKLMDGYDFDTILFPFNFTTWHAGNFGPQVLEKARSKGMGILALKAMAKRPWEENESNKIPKCWYEPLTDPEDARLALRFTLSHPITAAIPPGNENLFSMALGLAGHFKPLEAGEVEIIRKKGVAGQPIFSFPMG